MPSLRSLLSNESGPCSSLTPSVVRLRRQTRNAAIPMRMQSTVQVGPKTQVGGLKDGLASVGYQVATLPTVAAPERPPLRACAGQ